MSLDDLSGKLDPEQRDKIYLHLLTASIVEVRSLRRLILQIISDGDENNYRENHQRLYQMNKEEYDNIRQQMYKSYGLMPPDLFDDEG